MKKDNIVIVMMLLCLTTMSNIVTAQWVQTNGPTAGQINCLAIKDSNLYAGTVGGIYVSSNNGLNWKSIENGLSSDPDILSIVFKDSNIFVGTDLGIYVSKNIGLSWEHLGLKDLTGDHYPNINCMAVKDNFIFASEQADDLYRSSDNGVHWTSVNGGYFSNSTGSDIVFNDSLLFAGNGRGVYMSKNNGDSWVNITLGWSNFTADLLVLSGTKLFCAVDHNGIYLTKDLGNTWNNMSYGLPQNILIYSLKIIGDTIYAGTQDRGIYKSSIDSINWISTNKGLINSTYEIHAIAIKDNNIFIGTTNGVYCSTGYTNNWVQKNDGLTNALVLTMAVKGSKVYAGTYLNGLFLSEDNGLNWKNINGNLPIKSVVALALDDSDIYAFIFSLFDCQGLYKSNDNGSNWVMVNDKFKSSFICSMVNNGNELIVGSDSGELYVSENKGRTWVLKNKGLPKYSIYSLAASGNTIIAGFFDANVYPDSFFYISRNNGLDWSKISINNESYDGTIFPIIIDGSDIYIGYPLHIYHSSNNGYNWTSIADWQHGAMRSFLKNGSDILVSSDDGVYLIPDGENKTIPINDGLETTRVGSMLVSDSYVIANVVNAGIWRRPINELVSIKDNPKINDKVSVYPNPAIDYINIEWENINYKSVNIILFDLVGRALINENLKSSLNNYRIDFHSFARSSYLLRFTTTTNTGEKTVKSYKVIKL